MGGYLVAVQEVLLEVARRGITLRCGRTEDRLGARPKSRLTTELMADLKAHKAEIIEIMREDQRKLLNKAEEGDAT